MIAVAVSFVVALSTWVEGLLFVKRLPQYWESNVRCMINSYFANLCDLSHISQAKDPPKPYL